MFGQPAERIREPGDIHFHPLKIEEYNIPPSFGMQVPRDIGSRPDYRDFLCGECGRKAHGRVLCDLIRKKDGHKVLWCVCPCEAPTIIFDSAGVIVSQLPQPKEFLADAKWPAPLIKLFDESALAYAAGAYTASSMVSRKALMSCVCHEQEQMSLPVEEGKPFAYYVDFLAERVLTFQPAKATLDAIRKIGNDANHRVTFVSKADAGRSLNILQLLFNTIYLLTAA